MDSNLHGVMSSGQIAGVPQSIVNPSPHPQFIDGKVGKALWLNRNTINYGPHRDKCFHNVNLCTSGLSISLWLKPYANEVGTVMILHGGAFYPDSTGLSFYQIPAWDNLAVKIHDDTHYYLTAARFGGVLEWHHMIFSWKPLETIDLYINGCPAGSAQNMAPRTQAIASWTTDFTIAGNKWGDQQERGVFALDHLLIWHDQLTPEQAWQLYAQGGQV